MHTPRLPSRWPLRPPLSVPPAPRRPDLQPALRAPPPRPGRITPITWNLTGLDIYNANTGPNIFPAGVRVCNTGDAAASNVTTQFVWDSSDPYINLTGPDTLVRSTLAANACTEFYYYVAITRDGNAILSVRQYHITAYAAGVTAVNTPSNREIYVDYLEPTNAIIPGHISGPTSVSVGSSASYVVTGGSIPQLEQVVNMIDFPTSIFRVKSISVAYSNPAGFKSKDPYVDACGWENNLGNAGDYLTCVGPALTGTAGDVGGSFVLTYSVDVIATGAVTLTNVIYGFDDSQNLFYYNTAAVGDQLRVTAQTGRAPLVYLPEVLNGFPPPAPAPTPTPIRKRP